MLHPDPGCGGLNGGSTRQTAVSDVSRRNGRGRPHSQVLPEGEWFLKKSQVTTLAEETPNTLTLGPGNTVFQVPRGWGGPTIMLLCCN